VALHVRPAQKVKIIPDSLMPIIFRAGIVSMGLGALWVIAATWFSATRVITVVAELASFWLCIAAVLLGGWCAYRARQNETKRFRIVTLTAALAVFVVAWALFLSDLAFFHWKLRSVPTNAWANMISDMQQIASPTADGGYIPKNKKALPSSVRELGLVDDYGCIHAWSDSSPAYPGVRGDVLFGYKSRMWGLWLGPEDSLDRFCPGCRRAPVAPKAFFFVGPSG
jgi:hypothetical protein